MKSAYDTDINEQECLDGVKYEIALSRKQLASALEHLSKPVKDYGEASYILNKVVCSAYRAIAYVDKANYEVAKKRCDEVWSKHEQQRI